MSDQDKPLRKKMGLGRGLDALFGEAALERNAERVAGSGSNVSGEGYTAIAISDIHPNPAQPRRHAPQ